MTAKVKRPSPAHKSRAARAAWERRGGGAHDTRPRGQRDRSGQRRAALKDQGA